MWGRPAANASPSAYQSGSATGIGDDHSRRYTSYSTRSGLGTKAPPGWSTRITRPPCSAVSTIHVSREWPGKLRRTERTCTGPRRMAR